MKSDSIENTTKSSRKKHAKNIKIFLKRKRHKAKHFRRKYQNFTDEKKEKKG